MLTRRSSTVATTKNVRNGKSTKTAGSPGGAIRAGKITVRKRKRDEETAVGTGTDVRPVKKKKGKTIANKQVRVGGDLKMARERRDTLDGPEELISRTFSEAELTSAVTQLATHVGAAAQLWDQTEVGCTASQLKVLLERDQITTVWALRTKMETRRSALEVENAVCRAQLLLLCSATRSWLDVTISTAYQALQTGTPHWMKALAVKVDSLLLSGTTETLEEVDFFPTTDVPARSYKFKSVPMSRRRSDPANFDIAIRPILVSWFGFSSSVVEVSRSRLILMFVNRFGVGALYLPSVWRAYEHLGSIIDPVNRKPSKRAAERWLFSMANALDQSGFGAARNQLDIIADAITSACPGAVDTATWTKLIGRMPPMSESAGVSIRNGDLDLNGQTFRFIPLPPLNGLGAFSLTSSR